MMYIMHNLILNTVYNDSICYVILDLHVYMLYVCLCEHLRYELNFWNVHEIMNTLDLVQSK